MTNKIFGKFILVFLMLCAVDVRAQSVGDVDRVLGEQNRIQNEQEQKMRREELEREKSKILKGPGVLEIKKPEEEITMEAEHCFYIKEIKMVGAKIISKSKEQELTKPYLNKCIGINEINGLMRQVTNFYISKGYVTSKAFIGEQDMSKGILELIIVEGKIENIIINDDGFFDKLSESTAFPFLQNGKLNLTDIEQGLSQLNRLESNNATIQILPGSKPDYSIVKIDNKKSKGRTNIEYNIANSGQESTGENIETVYISNDNLLGINEFFNLNYSDNAGSLKEDKYSKSLYSSLNIPFGYFNLTGSVSKSQYLTTVRNSAQSFTTRGSTNTRRIGVDYLMHRGKKLQLTLNSALQTKDTKSFIRNTLIDVGSRKLTILDLGLSTNIYTQYGIFYLKPSLVKGLQILDAQKDEGHLPRGIPQAQFTAFQLNGFYSKSSKIPTMEIPFVFNVNFDSQISKDELFGSEQFYVGGKYSVRGFDEEFVSGENGAYLQNNLKFNLKDILKFNNKYIKQYLLNPVSFTMFYDTGWSKPKTIDKISYLSGGGVKFSFDHKYFVADLTYARSIRSPIGLIDEGEVVDFKVKVKLNLF